MLPNGEFVGGFAHASQCRCQGRVQGGPKQARAPPKF